MPYTPEERREAKRAAARKYQRRRYAEDAEYRESQKAHSREQTAARTESEREAKRLAENRRYAEDTEFRERRKAASREAVRSLTPEQRRERGRKNRRGRDPEVVRREKREQQRQLRREVLDGYGGRCECCGNDYPPHLTIDHVGGGGTAERRAARGTSIYRRLRREGFPEGYRVLCWNCNWAAHASGDHRCACSDAAISP